MGKDYLTFLLKVMIARRRAPRPMAAMMIIVVPELMRAGSVEFPGVFGMVGSVVPSPSPPEGVLALMVVPQLSQMPSFSESVCAVLGSSFDSK